MTTTTTTRPASPKQVDLITRLMGEKVVPIDAAAWIAGAIQHNALTTKTASSAIDLLFSLPRVPATTPVVEAAPGFYVRGTDAYKVQSNKAGTHTYALAWSGHSWDYSPGSGRSLSSMVPMTGQEAAALGLASGRCIVCCRVLGGESLSAKVAATIGYGEICANHNGWSFPKGAAAQRTFIATGSEL